jgi:6-phosphogluconolactonase
VSEVRSEVRVSAAGLPSRSVVFPAERDGNDVQKQPARFAYVGCRTTKERHACGKGISVFRIAPESGSWSEIQLLEGPVNPSFLALDCRGRFLYSVHGDRSDVSAFRIEPRDGTLTFINTQSTGGTNPVHLAVDPSNRLVCVANYETGTLAALPMGPDGALGPLRQLFGPLGTPEPEKARLSPRQGVCHPHQIAFDRSGQFGIVPDLGLDRIFAFRLDGLPDALVGDGPPWVRTREGAGPRHIAFHPSNRYAYVANELDSTVTAYGFDAERGSLVALQSLSSLPADVVAKDLPRGAGAAEIAVAPTGRFVYVSNRGHASIATFAVDGASGTLLPAGWQPSGGKGPRFFAVDPTGTFLCVANELTSNIVVFMIDQTSGELAQSGEIVKTGSPVCIVFN